MEQFSSLKLFHFLSQPHAVLYGFHLSFVNDASRTCSVVKILRLHLLEQQRREIIFQHFRKLPERVLLWVGWDEM